MFPARTTFGLEPVGANKLSVPIHVGKIVPYLVYRSHFPVVLPPSNASAHHGMGVSMDDRRNDHRYKNQRMYTPCRFLSLHFQIVGINFTEN